MSTPSNFTKVNEWVESNLRTLQKNSDLDVSKLDELDRIYLTQDRLYTSKLQEIVREGSSDIMELLAGVRIPAYNPNATKRIENLYSGVVRNFDIIDHTTSYVGFIVVPNFYILKFYIVRKKDKVTLVHVMMNTLFESYFVKKQKYHSVPGGVVFKQMFDWKTKIDTDKRVDPPYVPPKKEQADDKQDADTSKPDSGPEGNEAG